MKSALSHNEMAILDRQMATLTYQMNEIVSLLDSRLGRDNELAVSARQAQTGFDQFAQRVRRRVALAESAAPEAGSQTA